MSLSYRYTPIYMMAIGLCVMLLASVSYAQANPAEPVGNEADSVVYVSINTDDAEKMATLLTGVGLSKAQAIVDYRTQQGPFGSIDDLVKVKGIGPALLEKNRHLLRL